MFKFKNSYKLLIVFLSMIALAVNSANVINALKDAMNLCFTTVIPSLFPFMVLSNMFVGNIGEGSLGFFKRSAKSLFGISQYGCAAFICGILCGYPVGAKCVANLYKENKISLSEAQSLVAYSNNSGPLFIIGAVGVGMFSSVKTGIVLYVMHILTALICAMILKPYTYSKVYSVKSIQSKKDLTSCICDSTVSILNVCGFILFFSAINALILPLVKPLPSLMRILLTSFLEITNGAKTISQSDFSKEIKTALCAMALGWSGLSVHMQVKSIVSPLGISLKKYYIGRLFISIVSCIGTYLIVNNTDDIALFALEKQKIIFLIFLLVTTSIYISCKKYKAKET